MARFWSRCKPGEHRPTWRLHPRAAQAPEQRQFPDLTVLLPAGRHRRPDSQFRPARAHRRAGDRPARQRARQLRARQADRAPPVAHSRRRRRARAPGGRRPRAAAGCGPHARPAVGADAARRGQQPADFAQFEHCRSRRTTGSTRQISIDYPVAVQTPAVPHRFDRRPALALPCTPPAVIPRSC